MITGIIKLVVILFTLGWCITWRAEDISALLCTSTHLLWFLCTPLTTQSIILKVKVKSSFLQGFILHSVNYFRLWLGSHQLRYFRSLSWVRKNVPYKCSNDHMTAIAGRSCSCVPITTWAGGGHPGFLRSLMRTCSNQRTILFAPVIVNRTRLWCFPTTCRCSCASAGQ